jgi:hypothetical protein
MCAEARVERHACGRKKTNKKYNPCRINNKKSSSLLLLCRKEEKGGQLKGAGDAQIFIS